MVSGMPGLESEAAAYAGDQLKQMDNRLPLRPLPEKGAIGVLKWTSQRQQEAIFASDMVDSGKCCMLLTNRMKNRRWRVNKGSSPTSC